MSNQGQTLWINNPTLSNYVRLFQEYPFARFFLNSTIVSTFTTLIAVSFAAFAGYSISRFRFPGRMLVGILILATQMIPGIAILIPLYVLFNKLRLLDSYMGLVVSYNAFAIPFCTWMIKGFFDSIPSELEEAALIDGCTQWAAFWRIALPLSLPGLLATGIFAFILGWHEFIFAATFINSTELKTLTVGIASMKGIDVIDWGLLNAGAVIVTIPLAVLFAIVQRYLVQGLTAGAVKG
jgi:ABC-type glycerol-3-phosphate transport system permease component